MVFEVLLRTPFDGPWLSMQDPSAVLTARRSGDLRACLDAVEDAARGGSYVAGFLTYEAAAAFGLAVHEPRANGLPLARFGIFPRQHVRRLEAPPLTAQEHPVSNWAPSVEREDYADALRRIKFHIAEGDTYQLNFTYRLRAPFGGNAQGLFNDVVAAQAGAWSAYIDVGTHAICSASPELFFSLRSGRIECRPMKGTLPRAFSARDDVKQRERLRGSEKNRSENVMIVDLVRNDLGRVASVGSVSVRSLFDVERFPRQWQMTSTVTADVRDVRLSDLFAALFPSGSVTGAPKARSMEIIRELEQEPRGVYTGAIGLIDPLGRAHFNVAIRTVVIDRVREEAEFGVGGGIVWESSAADEYEECRTKAAILLNRDPAFELLETLRWTPNEGYALLDRHLERVSLSADYFALPCAVAEIGLALQSAVAHRTCPAKVRLLVGRDGRPRCEVADLPARGADRVRTALAAAPVSADNVFLYHKTTQRDVYEAARASRPDADAVLLWNEAGEVTEGTDANVVVELGGRRVTPPVECGLLPGTMRADLLARGEIVEQLVTRADLRRAGQMWLINSVRGWVELELID